MTINEKHKLEIAKERGIWSKEMWGFIKNPNDNNEQDIHKITLNINNTNTSDENKIKEEVEKYWRELGNNNTQGPANGWNLQMVQKHIQVQEEPFNFEEIKNTIKKLKNNKSPGPDGIPGEFYKKGGDMIIEDLKELFKKILENEKVPTEWNEGKTTLIHKGGNKCKK